MLPSIGPLPRSSSPQLAPASWQPRQRLMWAHLPFISDAMNPVLQSSCPMLQRPICRRLHQASGTCASREYAWVPPSCKRSCVGSPGGPCGGQQDGGRLAAALRPAGRQTGHLPEGDRCTAIHPAQTGGLSCSDGKCAAAHKLGHNKLTCTATVIICGCPSVVAPVAHRPCRQTGACLHHASLAAAPTSRLPHTLAWWGLWTVLVKHDMLFFC